MSLEEIIQNQMKHERLVLLNDLHIPYHDKDTLNSVKRGVKYLKPDILLLGGDIADFYNVSSFNKNPNREHSMHTEVSEVQEILKDMTKWNAKSIKYLIGNHEERLQRYIVTNAPDLHWVEGLKLENILNLKKLNIDFIKDRYWIHNGVMYSHLDKALKWGGSSSKNIGLDYNMPVVHTHVHRVGHTRHGNRDFYDNGCLCELKAEYVSGPVMWNQAFMIVDYINNIPHFRQINIKDNQFILDGKLYTPKGAVSLNVRGKKKR
jgi:predicted MPP superfamily phosphohydrolase